MTFETWYFNYYGFSGSPIPKEYLQWVWQQAQAEAVSEHTWQTNPGDSFDSYDYPEWE
jgi:hypothetical protein